MSHEYLSDEELQKLIMDVELNDMTKAPANLQKKVLDAVDAADKAGNIAKTKKQKIRFFSYIPSSTSTSPAKMLYILLFISSFFFKISSLKETSL